MKKDVLLTVRMSREENDKLDYLSDYFGKTRSDTLYRACKFFIGSGGEDGMDDVEEGLKKERKDYLVHLRMPRADVDDLDEIGRERGETVSQTVRRAFKKFYRFAK